MKTFKEIFTTDFSKQLTDKDPTTRKFANILIDSYYLNQLRIFLPSSLAYHLIIIMRSKIHAKQIAFGFNSHAACIEFNKYHSTTLYQMIQKNAAIREKLRLQDCESLQGFVAKPYTKLHDITEVKLSMLQEKSYGNFTNHATHIKLHKQFERIRNMILQHHKQTKLLTTQQINSHPEIYSLQSRTFPKKSINATIHQTQISYNK
ncbi:hypothetical protein CQA66_07360 [Helicobacter aurati]|uniref:Uncharacterized protein n=1 Tax=Helicobacter aurati TaxID=137778 RepID=A0A3D8J2D9_9HELI|nr:hypothetical protein [Helicobacter aurati]RDU71024.1 hypothetical protein CQA66_07360 [Helicobacter aurati]